MEALEEKKRRLDEMKRYCNSEMLIVTLNFIVKNRLREQKPVPVSTTATDEESLSAVMKR